MPTLMVVQISLKNMNGSEFADFQLRFLAEHCPHLRACSLQGANIRTAGLRYTSTSTPKTKQYKHAATTPPPVLLAAGFTPLQVMNTVERRLLFLVCLYRALLAYCPALEALQLHDCRGLCPEDLLLLLPSATSRGPKLKCLALHNQHVIDDVAFRQAVIDGYQVTKLFISHNIDEWGCS